MRHIADIGLVGDDEGLAAIDAALAAQRVSARRLPADASVAALGAVQAIIVADAAPAIIRRWRAAGVDAAILWLTRSDPHLAAEALDAGVDDLLVPPVTADEVLLRITVARRRRAAAPIPLADRTIDLAAGTVVGPAGAEPLTPTEVRLLAALARAEGQPVSREALLHQVWGYSVAPRSRAVDNAVRRLRTKLEPDPAAPEALLTVHRVGYRLKVPTPTAPPPPAEGPGRPALEPPPWRPRPSARASCEQALGSHRALWLWGPAGIGKSRLVRRLGLDDWGSTLRLDGRGLTGPSAVLTRLAMALDVALVGSQQPRRIGHALAGRGAISLVIDGAEIAAESLEPLIDLWRVMAPQCRVIVTARSRAEVPYAVRLSPLEPAAACALLLACTARHRSVPPEADELARQIVERIDRSPQTIALIAGRLRYASFEAICAGLRDGVARGRPLGAARDWLHRAWSGLDRWHRGVLVAASQFPGAFDLVELSAIKPAPDPRAPHLSGMVDDLIGASLIEVDRGPPPRLRLLPSVRDAVRSLTASGWHDLVERYASWCVRAGRQAADDLDGPMPSDAVRRLIELLPALDAVSDRQELPYTLRVEAALAAGSLYARRRVLDDHAARLAGLAAGSLPQALRVRLGLQRAGLALLGGRAEHAGDLLEGLAALGELPPRTCAAVSLIEARLALRVGALPRAEAVIERGIQAAARAGDRRLEGELLDRAATLARRRGALDEAAAHLDRATTLLAGAGAVLAELMATGNQALVALEQGAPERAEQLWRHLAERAGRAELRGAEMEAWINLGAALLARGVHDEAEQRLSRALEHARRRGLQRERSLVTYQLGRLAADRGDRARATARFEAARRIARSYDDVRVAAAATLWGGLVALGNGDPVAAARACSACADAVARLAPALGPLWYCVGWLARARSSDGVPLSLPTDRPKALDATLGRALYGLIDGSPGPARAIAHRSIEARVVLAIVESAAI